MLSTIVEWAATLVELIGVAIILLGGLYTVGSMVVLKRLHQQWYEHIRTSLGNFILLGLEFLVGADIIRTVATRPTFTGLGMLALIVLIRTFLSFALQMEITGKWPWNQGNGGGVVI